MKLKDNIWLANKSIRNSRSAKITIIGLALSLILIITMIWLSFSFYLDVQKKLNINAYNNTYTIDYSAQGLRDSKFTTNNSSVNKICFYDEKTATDLLHKNSNNINTRIDSFIISLQRGTTLLSINNQEYTSSETNSIKFIQSSTDKITLDSIEQTLKGINGKGVLSHGEGFTPNGNKEIILSMRWLKNFNLDQSILNESIALSIDIEPTKHKNDPFAYFSVALDNDNIASNAHANTNRNSSSEREFEGGKVQILNSYKVVGIVSEDYYTSAFNTDQDADIWLPEKALYVDGVDYLPTVTEQELYLDDTKYNARVLTYADSDIVRLSNKITENGGVFPFFIEGGYESIWTRNIRPYSGRNMYSNIPIISSQLQLQNYNQTKKLYSHFEQYFGKMLFELKSGNNEMLPVNSLTYKALMLSNQYDNVIIILFTLGIVLFATTLLNYFNILSYNAKMHAKYYGIMRAMGVKHKTYSMTYYIEILLTIFYALIPSAVISLLICIGLSASTKSAIAGSLLYDINLSLAFFPVALIIATSFLLLTSQTLLFVTSIKYRKLTIVDSLKMHRR